MERPGFTKMDLVPCGKCEACRENYVKDWTFRISQEADNSVNAFFVTLTYSDENLPDKVNKEDVQKHFKRLRKMCKPPKSRKYPDSNFPPFKYFLTTEYGPLHNRPHYHAIYLNVIPIDDVLSPRDVIDKSWNLGFTYIGGVTSGSIKYVLKYVFKDADVPDNLKDSIFHIQSKGLGKVFCNEHNKYSISSRNLTYIPIKDGKKRMPRYISEKLYGQEQRRLVFGEAGRLFESSQNLELLSSAELRVRAVQEWQKQVDYQNDLRRRRFFQKLGIRYPR